MCGGSIGRVLRNVLPERLRSAVRAHNTCWLEKAVAQYGQVPKWMEGLRPHGHHIIPQKGWFGGWGSKLRKLAKKKGITDHVNDIDNLTLAPNGTGTHKWKTIKAIYKRLQEFEDATDARFRMELRDIHR